MRGRRRIRTWRIGQKGDMGVLHTPKENTNFTSLKLHD